MQKLLKNSGKETHMQIQEMNQKLQETKSNFEEEFDKESRRDNINM